MARFLGHGQNRLNTVTLCTTLINPALKDPPQLSSYPFSHLTTHCSSLRSRIGGFRIMDSPRLRIVVLIPVFQSISKHSLADRPSNSMPNPVFVASGDSLLNRPIHSHICDDEWWHDVQGLTSAPSPGIEDCRIERAGKRTLTVGGDGVGCYAFLFLRACLSGMLAIGAD